ncbi:hypothetical protein CAPTEDRAFT_209347 [Capitella teleta]|uniref:Uncharacterized protein n=1 Tax=Capitella teleta TaxID=283909 RepID=R7TBS8_CAPTE|nr:hypothetical protein CAPTEDRAFT_209347 [Capitella teleta]|eukprot:ELT88942.1 hypothetical protein CAPTEDRAFT_209347 [Capitella teleta]
MLDENASKQFTVSELVNKMDENLSDAKINTAAIGQTMTLAARPRTITPSILMALGIKLEFQYGSRLCDSENVRLSVEKNRPSCPVSSCSILWTTWINTISLDGNGKIHGMGMISAVTLGGKRQNLTAPVSRIHVTPNQLSDMNRVNIEIFEADINLSSLKYNMSNFPNPAHPTNFDLLWKFAWSFRQSCPNWSGFMQMVNRRKDPVQGSEKKNQSPRSRDLKGEIPSDLRCDVIKHQLRYSGHDCLRNSGKITNQIKRRENWLKIWTLSRYLMHQKWKGKERKGKERKGKERKGKERKGKERKGKERKGKERKGKERKGKNE